MQKKPPERMCIACHKHKPKNELVRLVKSKDGVFSLDDTGKLDGRGAYICISEACFEAAYKRRALERAFKMPIDAKIYEQLKERMTELCDKQR